MPTVAAFQGWICSHVEVNRTRGFEASLSTVEFHADQFPSGFAFETPEPSDPDPKLDASSEALVRTVLQGTRSRDGTVGVRPNPGRLLWQGTLVLGETEQATGDPIVVVIGPLYVVKIDSVRSADDGSVSRLRVTLADVRFLFDRGAMDRWSFNRLRGDGTTARDSLQPDGNPWTVRLIADRVVRSVYGAQVLGRTPATWDAGAGPVEFPPFPAGLEALAQLVKDRNVEPPCLEWGGAISFYEPGEGRVGYAPIGTGPNTLDLPPDHVLSLRGSGRGYTIQPGYPPDYVRVVGGERVQTVAVDDCSFVLHLPTGIVPLTDERVQALTKGILTLGTLAVWILGPRTHQGIPGVPREVSELLAAQAWRLVRVARVTVPGTAAGPLGSTEEAGEEPGPYAHLLPLQERAETVGGRRLPVTAETYTYAPAHFAYQDTPEAEVRYRTIRALAELRLQIVATSPQGDPWRKRTSLASRVSPPPDAMVGLFGEANRFTSADDLARGLSQARLLYEIGQVNAKQASDYESLLTKLEEAGGRTEWADVLAMGKAVEEFERKQYARVGLFSGPSSNQDALRDASASDVATLKAVLQQKIKDIEAKRFDRATREGNDVANQTGTKRRTAVLHENLPRSTDAAAVVYDAALGIVKLSRLPGWLENPAVADPAASKFVPKPVRLIFGSTVRPRTDVPLGSPPPAPLTGSNGGGKTRVPLIPATDQATWFTRTYRRGGNLPILVPDKDLDEGAQGQNAAARRIRQRIVTLRYPRLVELIPLEITVEGNVAALDRSAFDAAAAAMRRLVVVEDSRLVLARPWLVQCDGVVAGVRIVMRQDGKGFETHVVTGNRSVELEPFRTRERPRTVRRDRDDGARREGLR